jgi:hypothetical protein
MASLLLACEGQRIEPSPVEDAGSGPCPASGLLAEGEDSPAFIVVGANRVYWTTRDAIRTVPVEGGTPSTVVHTDKVRAIAAHGDDLFVADYSARVIRRFRDGQETVMAQANADSLTVAGEYLYWAQKSPTDVIHIDEAEGIIARMPLQGGTVDVLVDGIRCPQSVAVNEQALFFTSSCSPMVVGRWPMSGAREEFPVGMASNVVADASGAYYVAGDRYPVELVRVPNSGASSSTLTSIPSNGVLAADDTGVYIGGQSGRVSRWRAGSELETLATDLGGTDGIGWMALAEGAVVATLPSTGQVVCIPNLTEAIPPIPSGNCPDPIGAPHEIAATPRADREMELLAIRLDGTLTATQGTYDRLVADKGAMQAALKTVAVQYRAPYDPQSLDMSVTEPTAQAIDAGEYDAWDCLNDFYGLEQASVEYFQLIDDWMVVVRLKGNYDMPQVRTLYAALPGVKEVSLVFPLGDGPTTCASRSGDTYEYVVDDRGGDCPAGCTTTTAYHFVSTSAGVVEQTDIWEGYPHDQAAPPWYALCDGY